MFVIRVGDLMRFLSPGLNPNVLIREAAFVMGERLIL